MTDQEKRIEESYAERLTSEIANIAIMADKGLSSVELAEIHKQVMACLTSLTSEREKEIRREEREKVFRFQRRMYKSQIPMDLHHQEMFEEAVNTRDASKAVWIWQNTITDAYNRALSDVAEALTPSDPTV